VALCPIEQATVALWLLSLAALAATAVAILERVPVSVRVRADR
jgi:hypothetical protein